MIRKSGWAFPLSENTLMCEQAFFDLSKILFNLTQLKEVMPIAEESMPKILTEINCNDSDLFNSSRWAIL